MIVMHLVNAQISRAVRMAGAFVDDAGAAHPAGTVIVMHANAPRRFVAPEDFATLYMELPVLCETRQAADREVA